MSVSIELPEDISLALQAGWGDVPRRTLEAMAAEGYRSGALSGGQVRRMLGFQSQIEVHEFLQLHGVHLNYTEGDLEQDLATHRRLGIISAA